MKPLRLWLVEVRDYAGDWWPLHDTVRDGREYALQLARAWRERDADPDTRYRTVQYQRVEPKRRKR
jgi:hypothetical protein